MATQTEPSKKISKKTVIIASIVLILLGAPLAIYLITQNASSPEATWYDSSWNYRKSVSIANSSGSTLLNEDVLIAIDTSTLVTANKLQSDCGDLRFVDEDDMSILIYWIEGGCNTISTQVWIRIPNLPNGGKTIYMYYDNSSASNGEDNWNGNFITLSDSACSGSWSRFAALDDNFPRGSTSYGESGGSATHSHTATASTDTVTLNSAIDCCSTTGTGVSTSSHDHSTSAVLTANVNHLPPYLDTLYCNSSKLDITTSNILLSDSSSISGWTRFSALDSKFPRGASSYGSTGGNLTHSHTVDFTVGTAGGNNLVDNSCSASCRDVVVANHTHTATSQSNQGNNTPPYMTMTFFKKNSAGTLSSERPVVIFNTPSMPLGWERFTALDGYFPQGSSTYGTTGGNSTHSHSDTQSTSSISNTVSSFFVDMDFSASTSHDHTITWSSNTVSNLPPYLNVVFAKRKASQSSSFGTEESEAPITDGTMPTDLETEGQTNPTDLTTTSPGFTAIFNHPDYP